MLLKTTTKNLTNLKFLLTLALETSCDETGVAFVQSQSPTQHKIWVNLVSSQVKIHKKYGGVVPSLAARQHVKNLPVLLEECFKKMKKSKPGFKLEEISQIAYTQRPGLEIALLIGAHTARALGYIWGKPLAPVNHIKAHIWSVLLRKHNSQKIKFPAVCLVVSGGHTQLWLLQSFKKMKILGQTKDDAAGEAFDKVGRLLGLSYPGGPAIEKKAKKGNPQVFAFPRPMIDSGDYNFSFSGLKTAVLYTIRKLRTKNKKDIADLAASFQQAVIDVLVSKTLKAAQDFKARTVMLTGGVAANQSLRKTFQDKLKKGPLHLTCLLPPTAFSTDNAAMVGIAANIQKLA